MEFNVGLDLNRSHSEMKNNAFPKAKNVLLNDFGNALLTEGGMRNLGMLQYIFDKGAITNNVGTVIDDGGSVGLNTYDAVICGYIALETKVLLFVYDTTRNIAYILRFDPNTIWLYDVIVQKDTVYRSFSFSKTSIIKGTYYYNYLGQLIIAYNDVSNIVITNNTVDNKFAPGFWICNLDETYVNENSKIKSEIINNSNINGQVYTVTRDMVSNLKYGAYFIAYVTIDDNGNETELSEFVSIPTIPYTNLYDNRLFYYDVYFYDIYTFSFIINCIVTSTYNYKLIVGYKSTTDITTTYHKSGILNGNTKITDIESFETIGINAYNPNIVIQKCGAIEQYNNQLLLGNTTLLDENYTYLDGTDTKVLYNELQKIANNIYFTSTSVSNPSNPIIADQYLDNSYKFNSDEVYAMYIEYKSIYGTSLGTYHIPGRPIITGEDTLTYLSGSPSLYYLNGNLIPSACTIGSDNVVGVFINNNEYYPSNFPGTSLSISTSTLVIGSGNTNVLAGTKIRHHRMIGGNSLVDLIAKNIIIPSTLTKIIAGYKIYYAKRNNFNNLLLDSGILDRHGTGNYFMSFESLFNRTNIECIALRQIGTFGTITLNGTAIYSYPNISNWINTSALYTSKFIYVAANKVLPSAPFPVSIQSFLYTNNNILTYSIVGLFNLYSSNLINNCYTNYLNQTLILSNYTNNITTTTLALNGDSFQDYETYAINNDSNNYVYYTLTSSKYRHNYRYKLEVFTDTPAKQVIYPIDSTTTINTSLTTYDNPINNDIGVFYKTWMNSLNDINQSLIFDFNNKFVSNIPNRIIRSQTISSESIIIGWKNITGLDYIDLPKIKGSIISILVDVKKIYIQCQFGLFLTEIKDTLNANINVLPLDIFEYTPIELNKNNSIRSYNPFSIINTPIGVIALSDDTKIYLIDQNGLTELSILGVQNYLTPLYNITTDTYGSTYSQFVHMGIDIQNKRILFNSPNTGFNLSYNYQHKIFIAEHDYLSRFMININNVLYFIKSNKTSTSGIYKFDDTGDYMSYLNSSTTRVSYFDIIFNDYPNITKLLQSINWYTKSFNNNGSEDEYDTFRQLMVYNNTQCSNYIDLKTFIGSDNSTLDWFDTNRSLKVYDGFYYNNLFDMVSYNNQPFLDSQKEPILSQFSVKDWNNLSNFISNYFVIRFRYNGTNKLMITDVIPELIKTAR